MSHWNGWKGTEGLLFAQEKQGITQPKSPQIRQKPTKHKNKEVWMSDGAPVLYQQGDDKKWHRIHRPGDEVFDSDAERDHYLVLVAREQAGEISELERQVPFELLPTLKWDGKTLRLRRCVLDFRYKEQGITVIEDVKSPQTVKLAEYTLKRHLFLSRYVRPFEPMVVFREIIITRKRKKAKRQTKALRHNETSDYRTHKSLL